MIRVATSRTWPDRAGRARQVAGAERLHRVDDADVRPLRRDRGDDRVEIGLGEHRHVERPAPSPAPAARRAAGSGPATPRRRRRASSGPAPCSRPSAIVVSVDLPMPGEPPSRTSEPGTSPPPSRRSSSPMPVASRGARSAATSRSGTGRPAGPPPPRGPRPPAEPAAGRARGVGARSSASVFQASHSGHWPCHLAAMWPQAEQAKTVVGRGIAGADHRGRGGRLRPRGLRPQALPLDVQRRPISAIRSRASSSPTLSRTSPGDTSSPPQRARRSALLCTPPKLVASATSSQAARNA